MVSLYSEFATASSAAARGANYSTSVWLRAGMYTAASNFMRVGGLTLTNAVTLSFADKLRNSVGTRTKDEAQKKQDQA